MRRPAAVAGELARTPLPRRLLSVCLLAALAWTAIHVLRGAAEEEAQAAGQFQLALSSEVDAAGPGRPAAESAEGGLGRPVAVFSSGDRGVACFRIPALVRTARGTLLAFAEARHGKLLPEKARGRRYDAGCADWTAHEIAVRRSVDQGRTWSSVAFVAGGPWQHVGNPWPIATRSGRLVLLYVKHGRGCKGDCGDQMIGNGLVVSDDDGKSWGRERDVSKQFGPARGCMPGPGAGVELAGSGRLLVVSHCGQYRKDYVTYSDDGGRSWATVRHPFKAMDEGTLADLGGGNVLLSMRHWHESRRGKALARSADGGLTWSKPVRDPVLVGPVCQGSLAAVGGSVYFSNPASARGRHNLTLRRSADGGTTWSSEVIFHGPGSWGYSSIAQGVPDPLARSSGVLYESSPKGEPSVISFRTFPLDF